MNTTNTKLEKLVMQDFKDVVGTYMKDMRIQVSTLKIQLGLLRKKIWKKLFT